MMLLLKYFLVFLMVLPYNQVTAEVFECHFDYCDTNNDQYCNEDEERCSYCVCEPQPVIPECRDICTKKMVTIELATTEMATTEMATSGMVTTEMVTTGVTNTANLSMENITESQNSVYGDNTYMNAVVMALIHFVYVPIWCAVIIASYWFVKHLLVRRKCCFERSSAIRNLLANNVVIDMDDLPNVNKAKLPIEERGNHHLHTSPTDDNDAERHKLMIGPIGTEVPQNKCQEDDETLLKQPFLN